MATTSHEFRNPLNGIMGMLQLLEPKLKEDPVASYQWKIAFNSCNLLLFLVNDILDYSRIEAGQLKLSYERFSPEATVKEVADLLRFQAEKKGLSLEMKINPGVPLMVKSDENRIKQVLINLLSNAIKFTFRGSIKLQVSSKFYMENGQ